MPRYRLAPTLEQEQTLLGHCAHARYVWNLAVEQHGFWSRHRRGGAPGYSEQSRQLTAARAEFAWLRAGSQTVQQQALRDFAQAMGNFFAGTHRRPTWRKQGVHEGFRQVGVKPHQVERLSRKWGAVLVPKCGWVRFRLSRPVPAGVKSYRVTRDRAGRWHVAFAHVPPSLPGPGDGTVIGVDRGVTVSAALSTGDLLKIPGLTPGETRRLRLLARRLGRARRGSSRRARLKAALARLRARESDRRKNWVEQTSTMLAHGFEVIGVEDLNIRGMTRSAKGTLERPGRNIAAKAGLNRGILAGGWAVLVERLEDKAPGRVYKINPAYTSQRCSACRIIDPKARESQARFRCRSCGFACNADVNAARNIAHETALLCTLVDTAAGPAVAARGRPGSPGRTNREPQPLLIS
ncbi:RNA-guided endonuclease InsQ/TnpB family protein [Actinomadura rugatobispora]|uniref:RNA-guided endonuclease InsQ/TnpB family protein n=1 Tax=Actinomadura rugatobispora TaxID=1994 RepID=A0ABW0ZXC4_9ACTN|nr:RNA-guided endonuclease TnpB family protein [Actinomadura rugatobispora]